MTQIPPSKDQDENTYMVDAESAAEMARLLDHDKIGNAAMGGLFPERSEEDMVDIARILDIGCGPGGWVHEVAHAYPTIEVEGIDISKAMIDYARAHARVRGLRNIHFHVMNALKPLDFLDESFDLVNARTIFGFVPREAWPGLLLECKRILRPGGVIRLTELEWGFANTPAFETFCSLANQAINRAGLSFSPTGRHFGITPMLKCLVRDAGFHNIQHKAHILDHSYGTPAHEITYQDLSIFFKTIQPLCLKTQVATQEELDRLYDEVMLEMLQVDFCSIMFILTVWGEKP
jgi:ubiquinone/menaquinone biosynthesis C-methylase UbiE